jgi:hypothetical protein
MRVVAFITEARIIRRILDHLAALARGATQGALRLPRRPRTRARARLIPLLTGADAGASAHAAGPRRISPTARCAEIPLTLLEDRPENPTGIP